MMLDSWELLGLQGLGWTELLQLFGHFMLLSMLAVGGAIATAPDMHRYLVSEQGFENLFPFEMLL